MSKPADIRRIGLFTSGRQDWGLLEPVALAIQATPGLDLTVFVSGTHLLDSFGQSAGDIRRLGLRTVDVPMFIADCGMRTGKSGIGNLNSEIDSLALSRLAGELSAALRAHPVDVLVVLGDRIETLQAAVTAVADRRFLAHVHGGDRAPGEFDDAARHAITKLTHIHFPATAASAERIARMGEPPDRIHCVGSPAIDAAISGELAGPDEARRAVGLAAEEPFALVLYHPAGLGDAAEAAAAQAICQAVDDCGLKAVCIGPNSDPGREAIWQTIQDFSIPRNWPIVPTVPRRVFLRLLAESVVLIGNSSAGCVESAAVGAAVIDVGPRQTGREHSANLVHVPAERQAIAEALRRLLADPRQAQVLRSAQCVFGHGQAGRRIADTLRRLELSSAWRIKLNAF